MSDPDYNIRQLANDLRYQTAIGIHTMGVCRVCTEEPARGSGTGINCLQEMLAKEIGERGEELAQKYIEALLKERQALIEMLNAVGGAR